MQISGMNGSAVYLGLLDALIRRGRPVAPRGQPTIEILDVQAVIDNPGEVHVLETARKPRASITAVEAAHLISGVSSLEQLDMASGGRFSAYADNGRLQGAYGPRAWWQLERVVQLLADDPDSRQAVVTIWGGTETTSQSADVPCTTTMQFFIRDGKLRMRTTMRSNDAYLGFPIDIEMFAALQKTVAAALTIPAGPYTHAVGSFHLYERDRERVMDIIDMSTGPLSRDPILPDGALPAVTAMSPLQRWKDSRQAVEDVLFWRYGDGSEDAWRAWQSKLGDNVPFLEERRHKVCPHCRYVTDGECQECAVEPFQVPADSER